jgi:arrestin-related trafficking adapter 9
MHVPILDVIDVAAVPIPKPITITQLDHSKKGKTPGSIRIDIELDKAGYLKGEQIRLRIRVRHPKAIKNLSGAVVTLYRMSRFDSPR